MGRTGNHYIQSQRRVGGLENRQVVSSEAEIAEDESEEDENRAGEDRRWIQILVCLILGYGRVQQETFRLEINIGLVLTYLIFRMLVVNGYTTPLYV